MGYQGLLEQIERLRSDILSERVDAAQEYVDSLRTSGNYDNPALKERLDQIVRQIGSHLDADDTIFFARQLELIESQLYMAKYPALKGRIHFPVNFEGGPNIQTITNRMYDRVGRARIGLDFPRVGLKGKEQPISIHSITDSYSYNFQEIRYASHVGMNLDASEAMVASRAMAEEEDRLIYHGDTETGLIGAFTHPNLPTQIAGYDLLDDGITAQQFESVFTRAMSSLANLSNQIIHADTILMPDTIWQRAASRPYSTTGDSSKKILGVLQESFPQINFDWCLPCRSASKRGKDILYVYAKAQEYMEIRIPSDFETFPPHINEKEETIVNCHERFGGAQFRYANAVIVELPSAS